MRIGVLLCGHPADEIKSIFGDYYAMFCRLLDGHGLDLVRYDVEGMEFPATPTECDGWLISGSKHGAYEDHAFIPPLEDLIRAGKAAGVPMVGICFGHQIIAQALGGRVEKFAGGWSVGPVSYETTDGGSLTLNAWHQDQVIEPPQGAQTTASSGFCAHAALVYPEGIMTIQPHPEFNSDALKSFVEIRGKAAGVPEDILADALRRNGQPLDDAAYAASIANHFKQYAPVTHA